LRRAGWKGVEIAQHGSGELAERYSHGREQRQSKSEARHAKLFSSLRSLKA
jgi:hypothetical protein